MAQGAQAQTLSSWVDIQLQSQQKREWNPRPRPDNDDTLQARFPTSRAKPLGYSHLPDAPQPPPPTPRKGRRPSCREKVGPGRASEGLLFTQGPREGTAPPAPQEAAALSSPVPTGGPAGTSQSPATLRDVLALRQPHPEPDESFVPRPGLREALTPPLAAALARVTAEGQEDPSRLPQTPLLQEPTWASARQRPWPLPRSPQHEFPPETTYHWGQLGPPLLHAWPQHTARPSAALSEGTHREPQTAQAQAGLPYSLRDGCPFSSHARLALELWSQSSLELSRELLPTSPTHKAEKIICH